MNIEHPVLRKTLEGWALTVALVSVFFVGRGVGQVELENTLASVTESVSAYTVEVSHALSQAKVADTAVAAVVETVVSDSHSDGVVPQEVVADVVPTEEEFEGTPIITAKLILDDVEVYEALEGEGEVIPTVSTSVAYQDDYMQDLASTSLPQDFLAQVLPGFSLVMDGIVALVMR